MLMDLVYIYTCSLQKHYVVYFHRGKDGKEVERDRVCLSTNGIRQAHWI